MRVLIAAVAALAIHCGAAQLTPETSRAFDHYAEVADKNPVLPAEAVRAAHRGETVVIEKKVPFVAVPGGLVHDWFGVLFIPGATLASVRAVMQDYDNYKRIYRPDVIESKLLSRDGNHFRVFLRLEKHEFLTLVYDSEYDVQYYDGAIDSDTFAIVSRSTRIVQSGNDHGFLWRLNTYWRFGEADHGVYAQCRAISLSRGIPFGFGWLRGFLQRFPKESMVNTLEATRRAVLMKR
jgi:hypothetical protein